MSGIYRQLHNPLPSWWCSEQSDVTTPSMAGDGQSSPVVFLPSPTLLSGVGPVLSVTVRFPVAAPGTLSATKDLQQRGNTMLAALRRDLAAKGMGLVGIGIERFARPLTLVEQSARNVLDSVLPLTAVSLFVGLAGVSALAVQWSQRRKAELRLLWTRGSSPLALGGKALLELAIPILLGCVAGLLLARFLLGAYAPSTALDPGTTGLAIMVVVGVFALALLTLAGTATWRTARMFQSVRRGPSRWQRRLRLVPWELTTAGLAVFAWTRLAEGLVHAPGGGVGPAKIDPLALAFPLLVVVTVAGLASRLLRLALRASHRMKWWRVPSVQLAVRRLAAAAGSVGGVLLVGVLAIGTLTIGQGVAGGEHAALLAKSGTLIGANSSVQLATTVVQDNEPLPASLRGDSTLIGVDSGPQDIPVMVIDPATYTRGAWLDPNRTGETKDLLRLLSTPAPDGQAPAIRVGNARAGHFQPSDLRPFTTVGSVKRFPGMKNGSGYLVARSAVAEPRLISSWYLWSNANVCTVSATLARAGIYFLDARSMQHALDALPFYTVVWTFGFITALGIVLAVVAAASLLLAVETRRRQNALSGALAGRMGLLPRTLIGSHCAELGTIAVLIIIVGGVVGLLSAALSAPRLDPAPWLVPQPVPAGLLPLMSITVGCGALVVAAATWIAVRAIRTAHVEELIRG
ncbi:MAG: ABC transporter permease [Sciscionella sp.]